MHRKRIVAALAASLVITGCAAVTAIKTGQPLNPAQVQQDLAMANYLLKATGCAVAQEGATASPLVQISANAQGQQVLAAVDAAGNVLCQLTVPPTALPVPAPASAPPASATPAAPAPAA